MVHNFDIDTAKEYGLVEAIIINHLQFWITKNLANGDNIYDGSCWTYNSMKAYQDIFPYLTIKQIRTALQHLIEKEVVKTGCFNKDPHNRTLWYTFVDLGKWICPTGKMDFTQRANGDAPQGKCNITDIDTDIDTDNNTPNPPKGVSESDCAVEDVSDEELQFDSFRKIYGGTKRGLKTEFENFKKKHKDWKTVLPTLKTRYEKQRTEWDRARIEGAFVPVEKNLSTYINQRCWEEEVGYKTHAKAKSQTAIPYFMTPEGMAEQKRVDQFVEQLWRQPQTVQ